MLGCIVYGPKANRNSQVMITERYTSQERQKTARRRPVKGPNRSISGVSTGSTPQIRVFVKGGKGVISPIARARTRDPNLIVIRSVYTLDTLDKNGISGFEQCETLENAENGPLTRFIDTSRGGA